MEQLPKSGCAENARVIIEKPFGTTSPPPRNSTVSCRTVCPEKSIFRIDHYLGKRPVHNS